MKYTLLLIVCLSFSGLMAQRNTFKDTRDGQRYPTAKIGDQVWMLSNFNFATDEGSWCYGNDEDNCDKYGRLYTLEAAKAAVPDGWHLPTVEEYNQLIKHFGGIQRTAFGDIYSFENGEEIAPEMFAALHLDAIGGVRIGEERRAAKPHLSEMIFGKVGQFGGLWAQTNGTNKYGSECRGIANNCAVLSVSYKKRFHWEICDDAFATDAYNLRLVRD